MHITPSTTVRQRSSSIEDASQQPNVKRRKVETASDDLQSAQSSERMQAIQAMQRQQSSSARTRLLPANTNREVPEQGPSTRVASVATTLDVASATTTTIEPIRMKSQADAAKMGVPGGGVAEMAIIIAKRAATKGNISPPKDALEVKKEDGLYFANNAEKGESSPADGNYIFVTLLDRRTFLSRIGTNTTSSAHGMLSGRSLSVAYAGEARFTEGKLEWFSNASGTYLPQAELHHQAGFDSDKFRPVDNTQH